MTPRSYQGVVVDLCGGCGSVYLDPGEAAATGIDEATLFGRDARPAGPSARKCPCGRAAMTRFAVDMGGRTLEIDRSSCCGGVFLDAGEHGTLVKRTMALAGGTGERSCPRCNGSFEAFVRDGIEVDTCVACKAVFLDVGDLGAKGIDVTALFGIGPESAREIGPSTVTCPVHAKPMIKLEITLFEKRWEIERAPCGGVFLDGGEQNPFAAAARKAKMAWGDQEFAAGRSATDEEALMEAQKANALIGHRMAVDSAIQAAEERERRRREMISRLEGRRRRRGGIAGVIFDVIVEDDDWDDDW